MLERGAGWSGRIGKRHSADRRLEFVENVFGDEGSDLGSRAAGPPGGVRDHQPAGLGDRFEDQALVQWAQGSRIDNLRLDAVIRQLGGGFQGLNAHVGGRHDGDIVALAPHGALPERNHVELLGHGITLVVEPAVVDVDDGITVVDAGDQQPLGVIRRARHDHLQPGDMHVHRLQGLGMLRRLLAAAIDDAADHHRD